MSRTYISASLRRMVFDRADGNCADTGEYIRLFHPRRDRWVDHFQMNEDTGEIIGMSAIGRVTVRLLQMNRSAHLPERLLLLQAGVLVVPGIVD